MLCQKNTLYVRNTKKTLEISVHVDSRELRFYVRQTYRRNLIESIEIIERFKFMAFSNA